jgi:glycine dehydrogenase
MQITFVFIRSYKQSFKSYIGIRISSSTIVPPAIQRNILLKTQDGNAYNLIKQKLLNKALDFQTMLSNSTGMETANASLLDESTAAAEAMALL